MIRELCTRFFVWLACLGAAKEVDVAQWIRSKPKELEAVVFTEHHTMFFGSAEAPSYQLALVQSLWAPENEDLLKQIEERHRARLH